MKRKHVPGTSAATFAVSIFVFSVLFLSQDVLAGSVVVQNGQLVASGLDVGQGALFVNSTTGFVGIGVGVSSGAGNASGAGGATGPARPLHVTAAQDAVIRLQDSSGAGPAAYVEFYNDTSRWGYVGLGGHDDKMTIGTTAEKSLAFYTNNSQKMVLTAGGNVGIGTASPGALVDVVNGFIRAQNGANIAPSAGMGVEVLATGGTGYINSFNRSSFSYTPLVISGSTTSLMQGKVGIGTTSPTGLLTVVGSVYTGAVVHVKGLYPSDFANTAYMNDLGALGYFGVGGSYACCTSYTNRTFITSYANAAPGLSGMSFILEGTANGAQDWRFVDGNNLAGTRVLITQAGNVGIGTTSPNQKLDVNGRLRLESVSGTGSVELVVTTTGSPDTCNSACGGQPCLAAWTSAGGVSACSTSNTQGRCLCAAFGS